MAGITLDHVAVMVSDLEKSLHFYRDLLGFEVLSPEEHKGGPIDEMVRISGVHMREYRLVPPGGVNGYKRNEESRGQITLDLIQWITPESPEKRVAINHVPSAHICFGVEDLPAVYERLNREGDGNLLELNEIGTGQQQEQHEFDWSTR